MAAGDARAGAVDRHLGAVVLAWPATKGQHQLRVRATDKTGAVQPEKRVDTFPNGATGWHTISVTVS